MKMDTKMPRSWRALTGSLGGGYEEALSQGFVYKRRVWNGKEMLTTRQAATQLGITTQTVSRRRRTYKMLGLDLEGEAGYRYPAWQFNNKVQFALPLILEELSGIDNWGVYLFLVRREGLLHDQSPLQFLRKNKKHEVIRVIKMLRAADEL